MLGTLERDILERLKEAVVQEAEHRALTVGELGDALGVDRRRLDHALGNLDDAGLIRIRGDVSTSRSYLELTEDGDRAVTERASA